MTSENVSVLEEESVPAAEVLAESVIPVALLIAMILAFTGIPVPMTFMPTARPTVLETVTLGEDVAKLPEVMTTGLRVSVTWPEPFLTKLTEAAPAVSAMGALIVSVLVPY